MEVFAILAALGFGRLISRPYDEFERGVICFCLMVIAAELMAWWRF